MSMYYDEWRDRVRAEKRELDSRLGRLQAFIESDEFDKVSLRQRDMMNRQSWAMTSYATVLRELIESFDDADIQPDLV